MDYTVALCKTNWRKKTPDGYYPLNPASHKGYYRLHRFVYAQYHKIKLTPIQIIRHRCNNPGCVEISHLLLGTQNENNIDTIKAGTNPTLKLKIGDADKIRKMYKSTHKTQANLATEFKITPEMVWNIINYRSWKNVN